MAVNSTVSSNIVRQLSGYLLAFSHCMLVQSLGLIADLQGADTELLRREHMCEVCTGSLAREAAPGDPSPECWGGLWQADKQALIIPTGTPNVCCCHSKWVTRCQTMSYRSWKR